MIPFSSFWQGGFEGADFVTRDGKRLAMVNANGHLNQIINDYTALKACGITTVRETAGWRLCDTEQGYDFRTVRRRMVAAKETGIQICWTVSHYGWPESTDLFEENFVPRFAQFCEALAGFLAPWYDRPPIYSPVNEISFSSWAIAVGFIPCQRVADDAAGEEAKKQWVRAAIAGCDAIWRADPRARILHCDPIIHITSGLKEPDNEALARTEANKQYQAWDMLSGRLDHELGGAPRYLDLIGANYYHDNQWELFTHNRLHWHLGDPRRKPLHEMLEALFERYQRPILLAETSHVGSGRGAWIKDVSSEVAQAVLKGVDMQGICLYPIIDRPDWENSTQWHHSGLWDVTEEHQHAFTRTLSQPYAAALRHAQAFLREFTHSDERRCITESKAMSEKKCIVFSHLRWDFVFQRPQHVLSRLASHYQIIFIEEPVFEPGDAGLHFSSPAPNVTVVRPHTPQTQAGFHDEQLSMLKPLMAQLCGKDESPVVWFYTPMALPLLTHFAPSTVVYDCMDELALFENAPRQLLQRESALLKRADVVFTGGPSLYASKKPRHPNVHCFPSSVDAIHFEQALDRTNDHPLQENLPHPRLGYYGVIDERMDLPLVAALADAHPEWQIMMVGPVVKIDPLTLPVRPNIHYFGQRPYQALPQFLAGWDVCLMPFVLNDSTKFISPTKVLEYMAAELPIVSTAITDVVAPYGDIVFIGQNTEEFILYCQQSLALNDQVKTVMAKKMRIIIRQTSWEDTVRKMSSLIQSSVLNKELLKRSLLTLEHEKQQSTRL